MEIMPFGGNYYTVCSTIGVINRYFESSIAETIKPKSQFFEFLRQCRSNFLFKLIETIQPDSSSEDADHKFVSKRGSSRRRRIPNKLSKQRSQFLIKAAFKLEKIQRQFDNIRRQQTRQLEAEKTKRSESTQTRKSESRMTKQSESTHPKPSESAKAN